MMSRLTRDGTAEPISRDQILRHARGQGNIIFPVQLLTTSRIGNLTRLIHTLPYVMTMHTYIPLCDHVPDWQPRIFLGMVEARSVNVKNATTTTTKSKEGVRCHHRTNNSIYGILLCDVMPVALVAQLVTS